jgi:hypothetical protein
MLIGYEFFMVYEPWQVILHDKEQGIYFGTGAAPYT